MGYFQVFLLSYLHEVKTCVLLIFPVQVPRQPDERKIERQVPVYLSARVNTSDGVGYRQE